ncbi:MAG: type II and III secretion system protein family protein [Sphingomonadaceae bacterium]
MNKSVSFKRRSLGQLIATSLITSLAITTPMPFSAVMAASAERPQRDLSLSVGRGQLINLETAISDVFVSNEAVADVQVRSPRQIYIFAKTAGETSIYATTKSGQVVYSANVRAGANINSIDSMLKAAMPDANIQSTPMNGLVLLTGTVAAPEDSAEAERLVQAFVGESTKVISRLRSATPLQVNLQVKIAEVSRSLVKEIGVNATTRDSTGGVVGGYAQGRNFGSIGNFDSSGFPQLDASSLYGLPAGSIALPFNPQTGQFVTGGTSFNLDRLGQGAGRSALAIAGKLFGIDAAAALDLAEREGLVTTIAQPNLTALSGETASFLAGGEIPIPVSQGTSNAISIEYRPYGVSLSFTPTVLSDGRISMRVRPEISDLTSAGAVQINGFTVPALTTRRTETTVELGSGQSFMIGGLLQNMHNNSVDRTPGLGNVPVLGALFRSNAFRRSETELVMIVTPYLVKPVSANEIVLPTDGYKAPTDLERVLLGRVTNGTTGGDRPKPTSAPPSTEAAPRIGSAVPALPANDASASRPDTRSRKKSKNASAVATPGFGGN